MLINLGASLVSLVRSIYNVPVFLAPVTNIIIDLSWLHVECKLGAKIVSNAAE